MHPQKKPIEAITYTPAASCQFPSPTVTRHPVMRLPRAVKKKRKLLREFPRSAMAPKTGVKAATMTLDKELATPR